MSLKLALASVVVTSVTLLGFAKDEPIESFAYELQMTLKSTGAQKGKLKVSGNECGVSGTVIYRARRTTKVKGVVWGASCGSWDGAVFWNETDKYQYESEFSWEFLNRIGAKATEVEALWRFEAYCDGEQIAELVGAGFGEVKKGRLNSIKGDFAGWFHAEEKVEVEKIDCRACSKGSINVYVSEAWDFCGCDESDEERTAAHGQWSLKANEKLAKKLESGESIDEAYSFPKYVTP